MNTSFVLLNDTRVNLRHIHALRRFADDASPCKVSVVVDMGTRSWNWTPKSLAEANWLDEVIQLLRPLEVPPRLQTLSACLSAGPLSRAERVQTSAPPRPPRKG